MPDRPIDECRVEIAPDHQVGSFANAFRIVHDSGNEWFLDFLVFSAAANKAVVVARVRVQETFLASIRDRLDSLVKGAMAKKQQNKGVLVFPVKATGEVN